MTVTTRLACPRLACPRLACPRLACVTVPVLLAGVLLLAGCSAGTPPAAPPPAASPNAADTGGSPPAAAAAAAQTTATATTADSGTYVIGPGDQLHVFVFDSPQLSMTVPVRPDGRISTPLVAEIVAAGKTPSQLARDLTERLKEFVKDPNVTVIVSSFIGPLNRQIRVIGEAAEPQAIAYRDHMTVLDVMIMTKGLTRYAAGNRAVIVRRVAAGDKQGTDKQESIPVRLNDLIKDGDISQNVEMQPGDTLIIPQTWF